MLNAPAVEHLQPMRQPAVVRMGHEHKELLVMGLVDRHTCERTKR
jgi:hypothetical protein